MMFEDAFELKKEGKVIRKAVNAALENKVLTKDLVKEGESYFKTSEVGDWIATKIKS